MKYSSYIVGIIFTFCFQVLQAQFKNVCIEKNLPANELSIAVNPENNALILSASQSGIYSSVDSGKTWQSAPVACEKTKQWQSPMVYWYKQQANFSAIIRGDSNVIIKNFLNNKGNICDYLNQSAGKTLMNLKMFSNDKTNSLYAVWTQFDRTKSEMHCDSSFIYYSQASHLSDEWTQPKRISIYAGNCAIGDSTLMGAMCCNDSQNRIYVVWAGPRGLMFRNLSDETIKTEKVVAPFVNGWSYTVGKKIKSNGLPSIACDQSKGEFKGRIYICWSDEKHGVHDKNVFLIYSDDHGENWTEPILVTYGTNHKEQFMPVMCVDQSNGNVYIFYHDQQNYPMGELADVYLAQSKNGGLKFEYYRINKEPLTAHAGISFGKNNAISAVNGIIRPLWMQTDRQGNTTMMTALIDQKALSSYNTKLNDDIQIEKTFSFAEKINMNFTLSDNTTISAVITRPLEAGFEKVVLLNKKFKKGKNQLIVDAKKLNLIKGNYTLTFYYNRKNSFVWLLED